VLAIARSIEGKTAKRRWDETSPGYSPNSGWTMRLGGIGEKLGVTAVHGSLSEVTLVLGKIAGQARSPWTGCLVTVSTLSSGYDVAGWLRSEPR
jgi:hypothetical protein